MTATMPVAIGPQALPKRRYGNKVQWIVTLNTGRFGDWVVVEIDNRATEGDVRRTLTRTQRRKAASVKLVTRFQEVAS